MKKKREKRIGDGEMEGMKEERKGREDRNEDGRCVKGRLKRGREKWGE